MSTPVATNGSSRPTSCCSAPSSCSTCTCCCISGIGKPYDPRAGEGVIGRNYSYQVTSSVDAFFDDKIFNPFIASGSIGMCIDEFNGDNFDHGPHGFVGGGYMGAVQTNGRPIQTTRTPTGNAAMGRRVEEGGGEELLEQLRGRHAWRLLQLSRRAISTSIRPTRTASAAS